VAAGAREVHKFGRLRNVIDLQRDRICAPHEVRSHPQRYLTMPGHEVAGALLLDEDERLALAEKLYANG